MSCVDAFLGMGGPCLVGGPRHRCVVSCAVRTRCVTARGSVGVRQWLFYLMGEEFGCRSISGSSRRRPPATSRGRGDVRRRAKYAWRCLLVSYMPLAHVCVDCEKRSLQAACGARLAVRSITALH